MIPQSTPLYAVVSAPDGKAHDLTFVVGWRRREEDPASSTPHVDYTPFVVVLDETITDGARWAAHAIEPGSQVSYFTDLAAAQDDYENLLAETATETRYALVKRNT